MGWLAKLISLLRGRRTEPAAALTPADVRHARLRLEQRLQRLDRSIQDSQTQREQLAARVQDAADDGDRESVARRVEDLDTQITDAAGQGDRLRRRRQLLVEVERMMADASLAEATSQGKLPVLKSLDDLDRYIEAVAAEREVQAARTRRTEAALEAAGDLSAAVDVQAACGLASAAKTTVPETAEPSVAKPRAACAQEAPVLKEAVGSDEAASALEAAAAQEAAAQDADGETVSSAGQEQEAVEDKRAAAANEVVLDEDE